MFTRKDLVKLLAPLIIEQILAVLVGMVDVVMVAAVGETAVSGVSLVDNINILIINIFSALSTGGAVVVSQYLGRKDPEQARSAAKQLLYVVTIVALLIMAVGLAFALAAQGENFAGAAALAMGIGIQNFPEGAAIALPLRQEGRGRFRAFWGGMMSGSVEPLFGVLVVLAASWAQPLMPWLLSFAAGAMLYVVVEELVPQAHSRAGTCGFVTGFLIMMVLDVALG